jgi:peptidoglycan/LPS O-acetylase OafA/YrhL
MVFCVLLELYGAKASVQTTCLSASHRMVDPVLGKPAARREFSPTVQLYFTRWRTTTIAAGLESGSGIESIGIDPIICLDGMVSGWRLAALVITAGALFFGLSTGHYYISFILGVLLARYADWFVVKLQAMPRSFRVIIIVFGLAMYEIHHWGMDILGFPQFLKYYWLGSSLGCLMVLASCMSSRKIQTFLNWRGITFVGRISYSVYLLQFVVILCLLPSFVENLSQLGVNQTVLLPSLTLLFSLGCTIALSAVCYRYVEKPCIQLGHKLSTVIQRSNVKTCQQVAGLIKS